MRRDMEIERKKMRKIKLIRDGTERKKKEKH